MKIHMQNWKHIRIHITVMFIRVKVKSHREEAKISVQNHKTQTQC